MNVYIPTLPSDNCQNNTFFSRNEIHHPFPSLYSIVDLEANMAVMDLPRHVLDDNMLVPRNQSKGCKGMKRDRGK
jgi:hypothetical protein